MFSSNSWTQCSLAKGVKLYSLIQELWGTVWNISYALVLKVLLLLRPERNNAEDRLPSPASSEEVEFPGGRARPPR